MTINIGRTVKRQPYLYREAAGAFAFAMESAGIFVCFENRTYRRDLEFLVVYFSREQTKIYKHQYCFWSNRIYESEYISNLIKDAFKELDE